MSTPSKTVFLDHAAATPLRDDVIEVMNPYFKEKFYNPSSKYLKAIDVKRDLDELRRHVAILCGKSTHRVIFTSGVTESVNLLLLGLAKKYPNSNCIMSADCHSATKHSADAAFSDSKVAVLTQGGDIDIASVKSQINESTVVISALLVNNETGNIHDFSQLREIIDSELRNRRAANNKRPLILHTDASHAPQVTSISMQNIGVDCMSIGGAKIYGPKQSGALVINSAIDIDPVMYGGGQEFGIRPGTQNLSQIAGFCKSLSIAVASMSQNRIHYLKLMEVFRDEISTIAEASIVDVESPSNHIVSVVFGGQDGERLMMELDERGVMVGTGAACAANTNSRSGVLKAYGLSDAEVDSSLRFSFGYLTSGADIRYAIGIIKEITTA